MAANLLFFTGCHYHAQTLSSAPQTSSRGFFHQVARGETLFDVARRYGRDVNLIAQLNKVSDPALLREGTRLFIPPSDFYPFYEKVPSLSTGYQSGTEASRRPPVRETRFASSSERDENVLKRAEKLKSEVKQARSSKTVAAGVGEKHTADGNDDEAPKRTDASLFIYPVQGKISQKFSNQKPNLHKGIDIAAPEGTKVVASRAGRVIWSRNKMPGYGNLIIIDHGDGFATVYGHNKKNLVHEDQYVRQGEPIATVGQTGRASGPHVHFEIRKNTVCVDPLKYLP
jgi:murein DD-endopeptidase MepM/ murein hydrolase activator NlpD